MMETVEQLIARKASIDVVILERYYGYTPLTFAIHNGNPKMVRRLHEAGADIRHATRYKENYLHFAAAFNRTDIAEYLVASGLDVNAPKAGGLTPLHIAAITGKKEVAGPEPSRTTGGCTWGRRDPDRSRSPSLPSSSETSTARMARRSSRQTARNCSSTAISCPGSATAASGG